MDASFAGAQVGQTFGASGNQQAFVPDSARSHLTFRLDIEQFQQASALFGGSGFSTTEVLNQTFDTASLVGKPVTVGHFVNTSGASSVFSETNFTYSPYLQISQVASTPSSDQVIRGQDYRKLTLTSHWAAQFLPAYSCSWM
jgi:hypothetical protein